MPNRFGNNQAIPVVKKIMALILRHKIISALLMSAVVLAAALCFFNSADLSKAQEAPAKWKNFSENNYGFSINYPESWSLDVSYGLYGAGLMNADLNNKKCGFDSSQCVADCVDIRILTGKKPGGQEASGLFTQLYEDSMMVRDFSSASFVDTLDIGGKKVFKVDNDAPTASLTGACGGPLYVFDTDSGYFVYVFSGSGANASSSSEAAVKKMISSMEVKGKQ